VTVAFTLMYEMSEVRTVCDTTYYDFAVSGIAAVWPLFAQTRLKVGVCMSSCFGLLIGRPSLASYCTVNSQLEHLLSRHL
jgi:hypothetical protein